jgi:hypothetical protein
MENGKNGRRRDHPILSCRRFAAMTSQPATKTNTTSHAVRVPSRTRRGSYSPFSSDHLDMPRSTIHLTIATHGSVSRRHSRSYLHPRPRASHLGHHKSQRCCDDNDEPVRGTSPWSPFFFSPHSNSQIHCQRSPHRITARPGHHDSSPAHSS